MSGTVSTFGTERDIMKKALLFSIVMLMTVHLNAAVSTASNSTELSTLKDKIKTGVIETLTYSDTDLSPSLKDVIQSTTNDDLLISAYRSLDAEQVNLKHTILIVMIKKQQANAYSSAEIERTKTLLVSALNDDHFWIRTEAVWGLRFFGDATLMRRIAPLVEDKSDFVRKEAQATLIELYELYQDRTDNSF